MPEGNTWICIVCRDSYDSDERLGGTTLDGSKFCLGCEDSSQLVPCLECQGVSYLGDGSCVRSVSDEEMVCQSCYEDEGYDECTNCGYAAHQDNMVETDTGDVCDECAEDGVSCHDCGWYTVTSLSYQGQDYCNSCARAKVERAIRDSLGCDNRCEEHNEQLIAALRITIPANAFGFEGRTWDCVECGRLCIGLPSGGPWDVAYMIRHNNFEAAICLHCRPGGVDGPRYRINNYSFKPPPKFQRTSRDLEQRALHFGTEVEIEMEEGKDRNFALSQLAVADEAKIFYCKADTSVRTGFELVSHPFTYNWMKENPNAFQAQFGLAGLMRGWSAEGCGMHVHMSANAFSNLHLFKFMRFFYQNPGFIQSLARRPKGRLEQWAPIKAPEKKALVKYALDKRRGLSVGRGALSFPTETVECRIFRSTLSPTAYYGNIEFLQSLFDFTKNCGMDDTQLIVDRYMEFVHERASAYNNFVLLAETIRPVIQDDGEV